MRGWDVQKRLLELCTDFPPRAHPRASIDCVSAGRQAIDQTPPVTFQEDTHWQTSSSVNEGIHVFASVSDRFLPIVFTETGWELLRL